jgi:hypothetical protein
VSKAAQAIPTQKPADSSEMNGLDPRSAVRKHARLRFAITRKLSCAYLPSHSIRALPLFRDQHYHVIIYRDQAIIYIKMYLKYLLFSVHLCRFNPFTLMNYDYEAESLLGGF